MQGEVEAGLRRRGLQPRGRATRKKLLDAAEYLFTRAGYDGTSIGDVAGRAGVGVGTLYHHFADKRAMLLELIERWGDRFAGQQRSDLELATFLGQDPRAAIENWLERAHARLAARPSLYLVVLGMVARDADVRARYHRVEQLAVARLVSLIEFGQRRGLFRAELDAHSAAFLIHHSLDMAVLQLLLRQHADLPPLHVRNELAQMICRYLIEAPPRSAGAVPRTEEAR